MDITPLKSCLMRLKEVRAACDAEPENEFYRDALIHRFELTFDLSVRAMIEWLRVHSVNKLGPSPTQGDTIRAALATPLMDGTLVDWYAYNGSRLSTGNAYEARAALDVVQATSLFIDEVTRLLGAFLSTSPTR